jgi:hypothetical protein
MSKEKESELVDKIQDWLHEQNYQFNIAQDEVTGLNLTFWPTPEIKLNAIIQKDAVQVTTIMSFTLKGLERLSSMSAESKKTFEQDLHLSLLSKGIDHEFVYNNKILSGVRVYRVIFFDGINKTKFFDTISTILHSALIISIKHQQLIINP